MYLSTIGLLIFCLACCFLPGLLAAPRKKHYNVPADIRRLLTGNDSTNLGHLLEQRAGPNQRLLRTFGISNTFVSASTSIHDRFRKQAMSLVQIATRRGWASFHQVAMQSLDTYLPIDGSSLPLDQLIRCAVFSTIEISLLGVDADPADFPIADVDFVTSNIMKLWKLSKSDSANAPKGLLDEINSRLRLLLKNEPRYAESPLDIIIPTWETMWRAVIFCLTFTLQGAFHDSFISLHLDMHKQFKHFAIGPDGIALPSPEAIVTESLRLCPPSKRISRHVPNYFLSYVIPERWLYRVSQILATSLAGFSLQPRLTPATEVADVESAQRSIAIWGSTAGDFDPMRFHPERITRDQEEALFPFGYGKISCVAAKWSPMAIAVLTEAILDSGVVVDKPEGAVADTLDSRGDWVGWTIRRKE